jgi:tetratricopeptide (TPR) repeat protein
MYPKYMKVKSYFKEKEERMRLKARKIERIKKISLNRQSTVHTRNKPNFVKEIFNSSQELINKNPGFRSFLHCDNKNLAHLLRRQSISELNCNFLVIQRNQGVKKSEKRQTDFKHKYRFNSYTLKSMSREEIKHLLKFSKKSSLNPSPNSKELVEEYSLNAYNTRDEGFTRSSKNYSMTDLNNKDLSIKNLLSKFSRNENIYVQGEDGCIHKRCRSNEVLHKIKQSHSGAKIYKRKIKELGSKKPVSMQRKNEAVNLSNVKNAFVNFIAKSLMSKESGVFHSIEKGVSTDPKIIQFIQKIKDEQVDNDLLSFWCKAVELEPPKPKSSKNNFQDSVFWTRKGYEMSLEGNINNAIDYYFQGLKKSSKNFIICYNLGCIYSSINLQRTALNWLAKAHLSNPNALEPIYACAIMCYRNRRYQIALDFALDWYRRLKSLKFTPQENTYIKDENFELNLRYIIAICYKMIGNTKLSNEYYSKLSAEIFAFESKDLVKYTWGLILLPLIEERTKKLEMMEDLKSIISYQCANWEKDELRHSYDYIQEKCFKLDDCIETIKKSLSTVQGHFFSAFSEEEFCDEIMPYLIIKKLQKNDVIFTSRKSVSVVLQGDVIMKSHQTHLRPSKLLARYTKGDLIGWENDGGQSLENDSWWVARWMTIIAMIKYSDFKKIWKKRIEKLPNFALQKIKGCTIFKHLSEVTLVKLFDIIQSRNYPKGALICPQSKKSPINFAYLPFFEKHMQTIFSELDDECEGDKEKLAIKAHK